MPQDIIGTYSFGVLHNLCYYLGKMLVGVKHSSIRKLLIFISFQIVLSSDLFASEYCDNFKHGYRSISKDIISVPVCPKEPPIIFGQESSIKGFGAGRKAAKADLDLGASNYQNRGSKGFDFSHFYNRTSIINFTFILTFGLLAFVGVLQYIFLKELIFIRIRRRHKYIWENMGKPRVFELMENFHLLECLNKSSDEMDDIKSNDWYLFNLLRLTFKLDAIASKYIGFALFVLFIYFLNLAVEKYFL